jgi:hypothetical protein
LCTILKTEYDNDQLIMIGWHSRTTLKMQKNQTYEESDVNWKYYAILYSKSNV